MHAQHLQLPQIGIDTHAHLDMKPLCKDMQGVIDRAFESGVSSIGNVFLNHKAYIRGHDLFSNQENVFFLLGVHPHEAHLVDQDELQGIRQEFVRDHRLKALGEIGLDYFRLRQPRQVQINAFQAQLALARELDVPVVIHARDAEQDVLRILKGMGFLHRPLLWHCFGQNLELGRIIVDNGWNISIPGIVTYPQAKELQKAAAYLPLDSLMLETDCPFLAPVPCRGRKNEPAFLAYTACKVAELQNINPELVWEKTAASARDFFRL